MTRTILVLSCATAALAASASFAQQASSAGGLQPSGTANTTDYAATPSSGDVAATSPNGDWDNSAPVGDTAVNPKTDSTAPADTLSVGDAASTPATSSIGNDDSAPSRELAATPAAEPASASVSTSMAYAADIANAPGGVFKPKVGSYRMSAYASPPRPIPYEQLDAYLTASHSQQMARNWWAGTELASTASSGEVSATTAVGSGVDTSVNPAATDVRLDSGSDLSSQAGVPAADDPSLPSNGGGVIPDSLRADGDLASTPTGADVAAGVADDTSVDLSSTAAPISPVQEELNRSGLSGTPKPSGATAPGGEALTPNGPVQATTP